MIKETCSLFAILIFSFGVIAQQVIISESKSSKNISIKTSLMGAVYINYQNKGTYYPAFIDTYYGDDKGVIEIDRGNFDARRSSKKSNILQISTDFRYGGITGKPWYNIGVTTGTNFQWHWFTLSPTWSNKGIKEYVKECCYYKIKYNIAGNTDFWYSTSHNTEKVHGDKDKEDSKWIAIVPWDRIGSSIVKSFTESSNPYCNC